MASSARRNIHGKQGVRFRKPFNAKRRSALLRNQLTDLIVHESLTLTRTDARIVKAAFDRLVTYAKIGDLHHRRLAARLIRENVTVKSGGLEVTALQKLFSDLGTRFASRQGGYTTTAILEARRGDNAPLMLIKVLDK